MQIALAVYPNFTMLDIIGPFQVLVDVPGHEVVFVAAEAGPVVDHTGRATLIATKSFADVTEPKIVVVPGGLGDTVARHEHAGERRKCRDVVPFSSGRRVHCQCGARQRSLE